MTPRIRFLISLSLLLLAGFAADASAQTPAPAAGSKTSVSDFRRMRPISGDAGAGQGKSAVCAACHGAQGVAIAPNFPNLAAQSATYLYLQLKAFHDGQRNDPVMTAQAAGLSDTDMRDLATYYASLAAKPAGQADISSRGAQLYLAGDPGQGAPPCQGCHGPAGAGPQPHPSSAPQPPWATFPRLRGQSGLYLSKQLSDYQSGARGGSSNAKVMHGVANTLSDADVQALSDYLSTL